MTKVWKMGRSERERELDEMRKEFAGIGRKKNTKRKPNNKVKEKIRVEEEERKKAEKTWSENCETP